jgi:O-antigen/teichoic acid export membrane protein
MGLVSVVMLIGDIFSRTGFDGALIARSSSVDEYLASFWSAEALRGGAQCLILMTLAYPTALFYRQPELTTLLIVASLSPLMRGLQSAGILNLHKGMSYRLVALYEAIQAVSGILLTLVLAFLWRNVWALLAGQLATAATAALLSYYLAPVRPRFVFRPDHWRELWRYGQWEMLGAVLYVLFHNGDDLFVGRMLGMQSLGLYRMAYRLGNTASTEGVEAMRRVLFPAFASIQNDQARLRRGFIQFWEITSILGLAFLSTTYVAADPLVRVVFGVKWEPMIPAFRVLVVWGGLEVLKTAVSSLFRSVNRPDRWTKILMLRVAVLALLIYPLSMRWGIAGTSFAALSAALFSLPLTVYWVSLSLNCSISHILAPLILPLLACVGSLALGLFVEHALSGAVQSYRLMGPTAVASLAFAAILFGGDMLFKTGLRARLFRVARW